MSLCSLAEYYKKIPTFVPLSSQIGNIGSASEVLSKDILILKRL
jgi:hypothetical protein